MEGTLTGPTRSVALLPVRYTDGRRLIFFFLALMILNVTWALSAARWAEGLGILPWAAMGGLLLATALAHTHWDGPFPWLHGLFTGVAWVGLLAGRLLPGDLPLHQRYYQLISRTSVWLERASSDVAVADNLVFVTQMAFLIWWLAFFAAWAIFRQGKAWSAVLPGGLVLLVNAYYAGESLTLFLILYMLFALLLLMRTNLSQQEQRWRHYRIRYDNHIGFDFLRDGLVFSLVVVILAWTLPIFTGSQKLNIDVNPIRESWQRVQDEWARLFSSLNYPAGSGVGTVGSTLTLGGPRSLGDAVVMDVTADAGRYWRAATYDTYTGRGWVNTDREAITLDAGVPLPVSDYRLRRPVSQTVTMYLPAGSSIFALPQPLSVDLPVQASFSRLDATDSGGQVAEVSRLFSQVQIREGDSYRVIASVTEADRESLRQSETAYPEWVSQRYLQLPEGLPAEVAQLAAEITQGTATPYDRVAMLESYLRSHIRYNEKIAAPPPGRDGVAYLLFDTQEGYCDYYASALAVMARTLGIPARVATGYAQGAYEQELGAYRVRERDAHTWVEVFFTGYGWIEFEPTAAQPAIFRPQSEGSQRPIAPANGESSRPEPQPLEDFMDDLLEGQTLPVSLPVVQTRDVVRTGSTVVAALLILGIALWLLGRWSRQRLLSDPTVLERVVVQLTGWAARIGIIWQPYETPNEAAEKIVTALPTSDAPLHRITHLYVRQRWGPTPLATHEAMQAVDAWDQLKPIFRREWLSRHWPFRLFL